MNDRKLGTVFTGAMYMCMMVLAFIFSMVVEENLLRTKHDRGHGKDDSTHSVTNEPEPYTATS